MDWSRAGIISWFSVEVTKVKLIWPASFKVYNVAIVLFFKRKPRSLLVSEYSRNLRRRTRRGGGAGGCSHPSLAKLEQIRAKIVVFSGKNGLVINILINLKSSKRFMGRVGSIFKYAGSNQAWFQSSLVDPRDFESGRPL